MQLTPARRQLPVAAHGDRTVGRQSVNDEIRTTKSEIRNRLLSDFGFRNSSVDLFRPAVVAVGDPILPGGQAGKEPIETEPAGQDVGIVIIEHGGTPDEIVAT